MAAWAEPATEAMLTTAGVDVGGWGLDLSDMADTRLHHVRENARAAGLANVTPLASAAEDLDVAAESFDAAICRLGLMLLVDLSKALAAVRRALRPGRKNAMVVFTTPAANAFMAQPMRSLLRHAGKTPPAPGPAEIFALGASSVRARLLGDSAVVGGEPRPFALLLRMPSAAQALAVMQEVFGADRDVVSDRPEAVQVAAWAKVAETLKSFETPPGFVVPAEVPVAAGVRPA